MTGHRVLTEELWNPAQTVRTAQADSIGFVLPVRPSGDMASGPRVRTFPDALLRDWESND
jgi:hypothetical protein